MDQPPRPIPLGTFFTAEWRSRAAYGRVLFIGVPTTLMMLPALAWIGVPPVVIVGLSLAAGIAFGPALALCCLDHRAVSWIDGRGVHRVDTIRLRRFASRRWERKWSKIVEVAAAHDVGSPDELDVFVETGPGRMAGCGLCDNGGTSRRDFDRLCDTLRLEVVPANPHLAVGRVVERPSS